MIVLTDKVVTISIALLGLSMAGILSHLLALSYLLGRVLIEIFIDKTVVVEGLVTIPLSHCFLITGLVLCLV